MLPSIFEAKALSDHSGNASIIALVDRSASLIAPSTSRTSAMVRILHRFTFDLFQQQIRIPDSCLVGVQGAGGQLCQTGQVLQGLVQLVGVAYLGGLYPHGDNTTIGPLNAPVGLVLCEEQPADLAAVHPCPCISHGASPVACAGGFPPGRSPRLPVPQSPGAHAWCRSGLPQRGFRAPLAG